MSDIATAIFFGSLWNVMLLIIIANILGQIRDAIKDRSDT